MGCSGAIFKWQLTAFMGALGPHHEFVFLDGEIECEAAPGLENMAAGPYLCYYKSVSTPEVLRAHDQVQSFIEDEGPFDGVVGFSQGSALAASMLIHHTLTTPGDQPPFTFAILFSGNLPFSPDHSLYLNMWMNLVAKHETTTISPDLPGDSATSVPIGNGATQHHSSGPNGLGSNSNVLTNLLGPAQDMHELLFASLSNSSNGRAVLEAFQIDPSSSKSCRPYHPQWIEARVRVPTLHIVGKIDPFAAQAYRLYDLCSSDARHMIEHPGGHDVPRDGRPMNVAVERALETIERSKLLTSGLIF
nr:hydrolase fub4 [Quercus suber]